MKLKRLSIFFVFILLFSILYANYYHHRENRIFHNDSIILDAEDNDLDFSNSNACQVPLTYRFITKIIKTKKNLTPYILTCQFFTRAPPV